MVCKLERHALASLALVTNLPEEARVVREHDQLFAARANPRNLMDRLPAPKGVLARERIVEHDNALRAIWITFEVSDEYGERERAPITGTERVDRKSTR